MAEDLTPDAFMLAAHREHLQLTAPDTLKDAEWEFGHAARMDPLSVLYGYIAMTDQATHIAYIFEVYDEIEVRHLTPIMH